MGGGGGGGRWHVSPTVEYTKSLIHLINMVTR